MFLTALRTRNPAFVEAVVSLHQAGELPAPAYVIDLDAVEENARLIAAEAARLGLEVFAMTKQMGRSPAFIAAVRRGGIDAGVAVDMVGVTGTGTTCSTASATTVGTLTSLTINRAARYNTTFAWSAGNTVLTVTIGSRSAGAQDPTVSGTAVHTPTTTATGLLSATGSFHTCSTNSGGGNCTPAATGSF